MSLTTADMKVCYRNSTDSKETDVRVSNVKCCSPEQHNDKVARAAGVSLSCTAALESVQVVKCHISDSPTLKTRLSAAAC